MQNSAFPEALATSPRFYRDRAPLRSALWGSLRALAVPLLKMRDAAFLFMVSVGRSLLFFASLRFLATSAVLEAFQKRAIPKETCVSLRPHAISRPCFLALLRDSSRHRRNPKRNAPIRADGLTLHSRPLPSMTTKVPGSGIPRGKTIVGGTSRGKVSRGKTAWPHRAASARHRQ